MTFTDTPTTATHFEMVAHDLYKDIHKGLRTELFAVTTAAGRIDAADPIARADVAAQVHGLVEQLESHAEHEDVAVQPAVELHLPAVAERIAADHLSFDRRTASLAELADEAAACTLNGEQRRLGHQLYLGLAAFTGDYLLHQDVEETVVMPALERAVGVDAVVAMHQAILSTIPPPEMAKFLAVMLPAMNLDDRAEMLGGMQAEAPAEVFQGVWGLANSVLEPCDLASLASRLGL
jgi:iron-sulfur cluster repair protein YtfE (RIC family)